MLESPILGHENNVIYTKDGGAWAYYRVFQQTIGLNSTKDEHELLDNVERLVKKLALYQDIQLLLIPVPIDIDKRTLELQKQYKGKYQDFGYYYSERAKKILYEEAKNVVDYKFFVGLKLKKIEGDETLFQAFLSSFKDFKIAIQTLSGVSGRKIDKKYQEMFLKSEEDAEIAVKSYMDSRPVTNEELRYIIRHQFLRGIRKPENEKSIQSLTDGILDASDPGYLKIEQVDGKSYVAFLPVAEFPIDMRFTRWLYNFQSSNFPIEVNIRVKYKGKNEDYKDVNRIKKRFRDQDSQMYEANEDEDTLINSGRVLLHDLENKIKNESTPLLRTHISFIVYGSTKKECRQRVKTLINDMEQRDIELVQPVADQLLLFHQALPGSTIVTEDWEQIMTPESFAESLFSLSREVGNTIGFYLGKNISEGEDLDASNFLVFYNPFLAHLGVEGSLYSSPHVTISGPTGMGKSYLLKLILLQSIFFGAKILMTDPKNEVEKKFKAALTPELYDEAPYFAEMIESFNFITLSSDIKDAGKLDPLTFLEGEEAYDTAISVLEKLAEVQNTERHIKTALYKAVRTVIKTDKSPGLLKVVKILQTSPEKDIRDFAELLNEIGTNGIAKLMFSDGNTRGISLDEQVNILQIQNLTLPEAGMPPMTREEHIAVCLMIPLAKFATKYARDDSQIKLTIFEEAWMLTNTGQGDKLINEMLRTGRSLLSAVYIVSQSTVDYNKQDIRDGIGTKFVFKAEDERELKSILEYLGLEDNAANRKMISTLKEGQCLYKDIYGRTAKIQTDVLFDEWVKAFNTKEVENQRALAEGSFI